MAGIGAVKGHPYLEAGTMASIKFKAEEDSARDTNAGQSLSAVSFEIRSHSSGKCSARIGRRVETRHVRQSLRRRFGDGLLSCINIQHTTATAELAPEAQS